MSSLPLYWVLRQSSLDFQDRPLESLRPQMHDSGNREHRRATSDLPIRCLVPRGRHSIKDRR